MAAIEEQAIAELHPDGCAVLDDAYDYLGRFVAYPDIHCHVAHALWVAHTHLMECWDSTPRIAFLSPEPGSGKSRALEATASLVPNPVESVNVSPAYLFRKIADEAGRPTILFDEIDTVFGPKAKENEEVRGLLNAGHRKGATAGRCVVRGKEVLTEELPAYCAVALAGLGELPDTILTRSVVVRMRRRAPGERVEPYRHRIHYPQGEAIRERLARWADSVAEGIDWPDLPDGIEDRNADKWEPLLAVADAAGQHWPQLARVAAVALVAQSRESTPSLGVLLLHDLRTVFGEAESLATETVLQKLHALDESPWGDLRGKPLDARGLSYRLRPYNVKPVKFRAGEVTLRGYRAADLLDPWARYLPPPSDKSGTPGTAGTNQTGRGPGVPDVPDNPPHVPDSDRPGNVGGARSVAGVPDVPDLWGNGPKP